MSQLFVHIPVNLLPGKVPFLLNRRLQPEVACQEAFLDRLDFVHLGECSSRLHAAGLQTILHAPYLGFSPGSSDHRLRDRSRRLIEQTLLLAEKIHAQRIVFHPGLEMHSTVREQSLWLKHAHLFWLDYLPWAKQHNALFCIENIYESSPLPLLQLISTINSPHLGHVFDIGHWNIFATGELTEWLEQMAASIVHLHLHDNHGERDEHLAIGLGTAPFDRLFAWLKETDRCRPTVTIENHNPAALDLSLRQLTEYALFTE